MNVELSIADRLKPSFISKPLTKSAVKDIAERILRDPENVSRDEVQLLASSVLKHLQRFRWAQDYLLM